MSANQCKKHLPECKAICCNNTPLPRWKIEKFRHKMVRKILLRAKQGNQQVVCVTIKGSKSSPCPFLREDLRCNIYPDRPHTCKDFGSGNDSPLGNQCIYLNDERERKAKSRK